MSRARLCLCAVVLASLIARAADDTTPPPAVCRISPPARPHLIPPAIYGLAAAGAGTLTNWNVPLVRWGGNTAERYNWELGNAWNTGHDWFFENVAVEPHAWNGFLSRADRAGAIAFVNVPLIGYVARNTAAAAFSVAKYGRQEHADPSHPDAGNGMRPDGQPVTGNDRFDTSVVASPEFIAAWVTQMKRDFPRLFAEHRIIVAPGNEPMLWHVTHRDVHPAPTSSTELADRFVRMARAIKTAAPEVQIAGPELWGWPAYFDSALDSGRHDHADRRLRGGEDLLPWFLKRMRDEEARGGVRLLDIVTVHFYPQAPGVFSADVDLNATRLRLETVRALWDPAYTDPSWIQARVALIPRLREWVAASYPGTHIGLTEYNWGGEQDASGGLALAQLLGLFGREGLDLACYWSAPPEASCAAAAYRLYRNVDGRGAAFGADALDAIWSGAPPTANLSIFAACDRPGGAATIIVVNASGLPQALRLDWKGIAVGAGRQYAWTNGASRIDALPEPVPPDAIIHVPPRAAMHLRFELKP